MTASFVLSRVSRCGVAQGYTSLAPLPAALLDGHFEHPGVLAFQGGVPLTNDATRTYIIEESAVVDFRLPTRLSHIHNAHFDEECQEECKEAGMVAAGGTMMWIGRVVSALISLLFAFSAGMKLKGGAEVVQGMAHLGLPESLMVPLGILEISCLAIYLIPATSVLGAILLTGYIGGAILAHLRIGEPIFMQIALGACVWLGLYLRESRLKQLIPVRTRAGVGTME